MCPGLCQRYRWHDRVRGVFSKQRIPTGTLLMRIPSRYCCFIPGHSVHFSFKNRLSLPYSSTFPLRSNILQNEKRKPKSVRGSSRTRYLPIGLFPEVHLWQRHFLRQEFSEQDGPLCLRTSASGENGKVTTVTLTPSEAALIVCIALRFFFARVVPLKSPLLPSFGMSSILGSPFLTSFVNEPRYSAGNVYVHSLPLDTLMCHGVESFFGRFAEAESPYHVCLEQLAWNLRDEVLHCANNTEYAVLDQHPSSLDDVMLLSLYIVRSRILPVRWIEPAGSSQNDSIVQALAPGVDALNHSLLPSAAVVAAPAAQAVVVRAIRPISKGEEITINYMSVHSESSHYDGIHWRYLMG